MKRWALFCLLAWSLRCQSLVKSLVTEPKLVFRGIEINHATTEGATAILSLDVENPNGFEVSVDRLDYGLEFGGRKVAQGGIDQPAKLKAKATTPVKIPIPFKYKDVMSSVIDLVANNASRFRAAGIVKIGVFSLPFEETGEVKLR